MNPSVVRALILKDWRLHSQLILFSVAGGVLSLGLLQVGGEAVGMLGIVWFFVALILLGCMLPVSNVVNERKKQNLAFMMSLPVSATQYGMAKLVSTLGMYLIPWLTLVIAGMSWILAHDQIPRGVIPTVLILSTLTLLGFCVIASAAIVSESEGWTVAATIVCNSTYGFGWYLMIRDPAMRADMGSRTPVWSSAEVTILAAELATILVLLGVTFYLQSRKRDFV